MSQQTLRCPDEYRWAWMAPAIECPRCHVTYAVVAPAVEQEQRMYDEWANAHRRDCPHETV